MQIVKLEHKLTVAGAFREAIMNILALVLTKKQLHTL